MNIKKSAEVIVNCNDLKIFAKEGPNSTISLNPYYIVGFVDGEGCFTVYVHKHKTKKLGFDARMSFEIELRYDDEAILKNIQGVLGCGNITYLSYDKYGWVPHVKYKVSSIKDIGDKIIPFFTTYPLLAKKRYSFDLFTKAYRVFALGDHLTLDGLNRLIDISNSMKKLSHLNVKVLGTARVRENRLLSGAGNIFL